MKSLYFSLFLITTFCISCNNSSQQDNKKAGIDSLHDTSQLTKQNLDTLSNKIDSVTEKESEISEFKSVDNWSIDDFIINKKDKSFKSLKSTIQYTKEEWKNVNNPFIAKYQGCDLGDYFHLNFKDSQNKNYDFGFGDNNYGNYRLFDSISFADNPKYLGKSFKIYWDWKSTSFPCCDGDYDLIKAYLPSITKLELVQTNATKK